MSRKNKRKTRTLKEEELAGSGSGSLSVKERAADLAKVQSGGVFLGGNKLYFDSAGLSSTDPAASRANPWDERVARTDAILAQGRAWRLAQERGQSQGPPAPPPPIMHSPNEADQAQYALRGLERGPIGPTMNEDLEAADNRIAETGLVQVPGVMSNRPSTPDEIFRAMQEQNQGAGNPATAADPATNVQWLAEMRERGRVMAATGKSAAETAAAETAMESEPAKEELGLAEGEGGAQGLIDMFRKQMNEPLATREEIEAKLQGSGDAMDDRVRKHNETLARQRRNGLSLDAQEGGTSNFEDNLALNNKRINDALVLHNDPIKKRQDKAAEQLVKVHGRMLDNQEKMAELDFNDKDSVRKAFNESANISRQFTEAQLNYSARTIESLYAKQIADAKNENDKSRLEMERDNSLVANKVAIAGVLTERKRIKMSGDIAALNAFDAAFRNAANTTEAALRNNKITLRTLELHAPIIQGELLDAIEAIRGGNKDGYVNSEMTNNIFKSPSFIAIYGEIGSEKFNRLLRDASPNTRKGAEQSLILLVKGVITSPEYIDSFRDAAMERTGDKGSNPPPAGDGSANNGSNPPPAVDKGSKGYIAFVEAEIAKAKMRTGARGTAAGKQAAEDLEFWEKEREQTVKGWRP